MKRITEFEIEDIGVDHPSFFQGRGIAFTRFEEIAVGVGENAKEAYEDAVESLAQADWNVDTLPTRPRGIRKSDCVRHGEDCTVEDTGEDCEIQYYVAVSVRGPKPRKVPRSYSRDDVERHSDGGYGAQYPAINVKSHHFPRTSQVADAFHCSDEIADKALEFAWKSAAENFWEDAPDLATEILGKSARVYSAGRSSGWLIVQGIGLPEDWTIFELNRWRKFESAIKRDIVFRELWEQVREDIEVNRWAEDGAEQYNFVDTPSGPKCIADLNVEIAKTRREFLSGPTT